MSRINKRKNEHIEKILYNPETYRNTNDFDQIKLNHKSLPEIDFDEIDTSYNFLNKKLSFPFIISSMTGGNSEELIKINKTLAIAAEETNVALALGSQRIMIEEESSQKSFLVRNFIKSMPLISNLGAVQLNYGFNSEKVQKIIDITHSDAIYLHLNPLQEAIQQEGNKNFKNLLEKIQKLKKEISVPLIIKEVGTGINIDDIKKLIDAGIDYIDLAGRGGTSFAYIEGLRSQEEIGNTFKDFGTKTIELISSASKIMINKTLIASGGIRNGLDIAKAIILGADICSIAKAILISAMKSEQETINLILRLKKEFKIAMFMLGVKNVENLKNNKSLILS